MHIVLGNQPCRDMGSRTPSRHNSKCKHPQAGVCLGGSGKSQEARVTGPEKVREGGMKKRNEKKSHKIVKMIPMEVDGNKAG